MRWDSAPGSLFPLSYMPRKASLTTVVTVALVFIFSATALSQTDNPPRGLGSSLAAVDLLTLRERCGAAEPLKESFQLVRQYGCSDRHSGAGEILAFEENRLFIYALADMSEASLDCLELSVTNGLTQRGWFENDSNLDSVRDHPRFQALLERF